MTIEQNLAIAREVQERMWNQRDMSVFQEYYAPDHINHGPHGKFLPPGPDSLRTIVTTMIAALPDVHGTIEKQEAEGDLVKTWVTFRGTQTGKLLNIPPTGRKSVILVMFTDRIVNGKIVESWSDWDPEELLRQLGLG